MPRRSNPTYSAYADVNEARIHLHDAFTTANPTLPHCIQVAIRDAHAATARAHGMLDAYICGADGYKGVMFDGSPAPGRCEAMDASLPHGVCTASSIGTHEGPDGVKRHFCEKHLNLARGSSI